MKASAWVKLSTVLTMTLWFACSAYAADAVSEDAGSVDEADASEADVASGTTDAGVDAVTTTDTGAEAEDAGVIADPDGAAEDAGGISITDGAAEDGGSGSTDDTATQGDDAGPDAVGDDSGGSAMDGGGAPGPGDTVEGDAGESDAQESTPDGSSGDGGVVCAPDCDGLECGDDGCGGSCGECEDGKECAGNGLCVAPKPSNGCNESKLPGCDECECEEVVCELSPECCENAWDGSCVVLCETQGGVQCTELEGCSEYCGDQSPDGCFCDASCWDYSDCCPDACDSCGFCEGSGSGPTGSCTDGDQSFCGDQSPNGCYCDPDCLQYNDCCEDACEICEVCDGGGGGGSCVGNCGGQAPDGCYCDGDCLEFGDCCTDFEEVCGEGGGVGEECPDWLGYEGCCGDGQSVQYCEEGALKSLDCSDEGAFCAWNAEKEYYDCMESDVGADPTDQYPQFCSANENVPGDGDASGSSGADGSETESDAGSSGGGDTAAGGESDTEASDGETLADGGPASDDDGPVVGPSKKSGDSGCVATGSVFITPYMLLFLMLMGLLVLRRRAR